MKTSHKVDVGNSNTLTMCVCVCVCVCVYIYIYSSDNICLAINKYHCRQEVLNSGKLVLCGRLVRRCTMVVLLNMRNPVLGESVFQGEGESCPFCEQVEHIDGESLVCSDGEKSMGE